MGNCDNLYGDCNLNSADGCEKPLSGDVANCGRCGVVCNGTNGVPSCASGACSITCGLGFANCNTSLSDGCEVNTNTSASNCGTCGHVCSQGCTNGLCNTPCSTFSDCTAAGKSIVVLTSTGTKTLPNANTCYEFSPTGNLGGGNCTTFNSPAKMFVNNQEETCNTGNWATIPGKLYGGYCFRSFNTVVPNSSAFTTW
jgi:hypothetical protein